MKLINCQSLMGLNWGHMHLKYLNNNRNNNTKVSTLNISVNSNNKLNQMSRVAHTHSATQIKIPISRVGLHLKHNIYFHVQPSRRMYFPLALAQWLFPVVNARIGPFPSRIFLSGTRKKSVEINKGNSCFIGFKCHMAWQQWQPVK